MSVDKLKQTVIRVVIAVSLFLVSGVSTSRISADTLNLTEGVTPTSHKSLRAYT